MPGCVIVGGVARGPAQVQGGDREGTHCTGVPQPGAGGTSGLGFLRVEVFRVMDFFYFMSSSHPKQSQDGSAL